MELENTNSEYVRYEEGKFKTLYHHFKLDNEAFKLGMAKIAFNYAIHCGLNTCCLERIFDDSTKKLINKPVVIPFIPMTLFNLVMEMHPVERLFHAVRIFNNGNLLYAYIELFNTFQQYVLLSDKYNFTEYGNIDKSYGNVVEMNEPLDENLLESVTPRDYKDADIIRTQYHIDINKQVEVLKQYHNYDSLDHLEQVNMLFAHIGKLAYEQIRVQSYIKGYEGLIDRHYDSIDFLQEFTGFDDFEKSLNLCRLFNSIQFIAMIVLTLKSIKKFFQKVLTIQLLLVVF